MTQTAKHCSRTHSGLFVSTEQRQAAAQVLTKALDRLLQSQELPDIASWEVRVPYAGMPCLNAQLSVVYDDDESRRQLSRLLGCLEGAGIEETRARDDTHTVVEVIGTYGGVGVRVWTHVDHVERGPR